DIGGTTTDIAVLEGGLPRLAEDGAVVGGHRTMVEAVALRTFGLGGDSEIAIDDRGLMAAITLGPRRILPLSLIGARWADAVLLGLERQLRSPRPGRHDGRFAVATGVPVALAHGLETRERELLEKIGDVPVALEDLLASPGRKAALDDLVMRGFVHLGGITPSDALHVLGQIGRASCRERG